MRRAIVRRIFYVFIKKRRQVAPAVFPNAPKGRKGEKEMGILKYVFRAQGPEERECRRESESPDPAEALRHPVIGFVPLTNRNVIHFLLFVKRFVKNIF